jgi:hypothetical protein
MALSYGNFADHLSHVLVRVYFIDSVVTSVLQRVESFVVDLLRHHENWRWTMSMPVLSGPSESSSSSSSPGPFSSYLGHVSIVIGPERGSGVFYVAATSRRGGNFHGSWSCETRRNNRARFLVGRSKIDRSHMRVIANPLGLVAQDFFWNRW